MMKTVSPGRWGVIAGIPPNMLGPPSALGGDIGEILMVGRGIFLAENLKRDLGEMCC
jgi:hypothetical protein